MSTEEVPAKRRLAWFFVMNVIAVVITVLVFIGLMYGQILDLPIRALTGQIFEYKLVVILIATSPLFAALLIGVGYMRRAQRRKQAQTSLEQNP